MPGLVIAEAASAAWLRRLRFIFTFINPLERGLTEQRFWTYLPANLPPVQRLQNVQASMPFRLHEDRWGHRILELEFGDIQPFGRKTVTVTAEVELNSTGAWQSVPNHTEWLGSERFIESDDPTIRAFAMPLQKNSDLDTARAIYDWVRGNLRYAGYLEEERGALRALQDRWGDCTEYADLVVALARAAGIPARMVGGFVSTQDFIPRPQDYHNWAELYLDGGWRVVDAQKENWLPSGGDYLAFRIHRDKLDNPIGDAHRYRIAGELQVR